jgi:hypothetical protein
MKRVFQILFNRPLQYENKVIYGVRVACDEGKAKRLLDYAVEIIGQWCFIQKHGGKITEGFTKWVDANGNIYKSRSSRQLYAYTAALATQTYFRIDEWMVDDNCDIENEVDITDPTEYFNTRCLLEEDDYKTGYNGWLQIYQRLLSRYNRLTLLGQPNNEMQLDYGEQEMWGEEDVNLQNLLV